MENITHSKKEIISKQQDFLNDPIIKGISKIIENIMMIAIPVSITEKGSFIYNLKTELFLTKLFLYKEDYIAHVYDEKEK